jgi:hypothetical protein
MRRVFGAPAPADPAPAASPPRPLLLRYASVEAWLRAWVECRRGGCSPEILAYYDRETGNSAVPLAGSLGMDSAITVDGEVWVQFGTHADEMDGWRRARPNERVALLVSAQRAHPELAVLLPLRPVAASDCAACQGKGTVFADIAWCHDCSARGWVVAGLDTRLELASAPP